MSDDHKAYWHDTKVLLIQVLSIWAVVTYVIGIFLAPMLNQFTFLGYPAGFWFAQQGAIYVYLILIFYYAWRMDAIDKKHNVEED